MFPILFQFPIDWPLIGGRALHLYGLLVATGFMAGLWYVKREALRAHLPQQQILDLFSAIILAAIIGSRVLYVFVSVDQWWLDPLVFIRFWEGGLVFYGGLIASVLTSIYFCRKHELPFLKVADVFAPAIALGHSIGRLGCFAAGCCYGKPVSADSFFAVIFPNIPESIAPFDHPVYATQIMESAGALFIFFILLSFRKHKKFDGEIFLLYLIFYPILRSIIEIFRGDTIRGFVINGFLSTSQFISLIWILIAGILWLRILRRKA